MFLVFFLYFFFRCVIFLIFGACWFYFLLSCWSLKIVFRLFYCCFFTLLKICFFSVGSIFLLLLICFKMASPGIISFNGKNDFRVWKKKIKCVLIQQNVYQAISKVYLENETTSKKSFMNDYAVSTISLNLSDSVLRKVDLIEDAKELWDKLDELFLENSVPNQMHLLDKFFKFSLDLSKGLDENLDAFSKLIQDIKETGNKSIDDYSAFALVNAIPDAYSDVRSAMKYGRDNVTVELVMSSLRTKELELKQVESKSEDKVMHVRGRNSGNKHASESSKSKKWSKDTRRCYNCGEVGHYIKDCPKPPRTNNRTNKGEQANAIIEGESSDVF